jgi:hypothetical protein
MLKIAALPNTEDIDKESIHVKKYIDRRVKVLAYDLGNQEILLETE